MQEKIKEKIMSTIPSKFDKFPKLESGEPYQFKKWGRDSRGRFCMYYYVTGGKRTYQKRVLMNELIEAIKRFLQYGEFTRDDFEELCPVTRSDGGCGFAVIGRILEYLYGAEYQGRDKGFIKV